MTNKNRTRQPAGLPVGGEYAKETGASTGLSLVPAWGSEESAGFQDASDIADASPEPDGTFENPSWQPVGTVTRNLGMYSNQVGEKASERYRTASEIAKDVRIDLKDAMAGGYLPSDLDYSVRSSSFAGGQSISITATGMNDEDLWVPSWRDPGFIVYSGRAQEVGSRLKAIMAQYNNSSIHGEIDYFDVSFYASANVRGTSDVLHGDAEKINQKIKRLAKAGASQDELDELRARRDEAHREALMASAVLEAARDQTRSGYIETIDWDRARTEAEPQQRGYWNAA